ncbi:alpha/beta fold hydrolase [Priestia megaterium]|uniref:alpha/beta fold hydrolase n=1 Tax=Priestia megaterium TaxID=1404 RepID=UPI0027955BF7|nr:alpha/beta fold hydrolase [Priestia megaterium]
MKKVKAALPLAVSLALGLQVLPMSTLPVQAEGAANAAHHSAKVEVKRANAFLTNVANGKTKEAKRYFSRSLQSKMSEDNLKTWWSALTAQFGSVKKIGTSVQGEVNTVHRNIEIPIEFEHVSATLTVRFSQNRQIDDWRIVPEERLFSFSKPSYDTPKNYSEKQLSIGKAPYELPATLTLPTRSKHQNVPVVILVHGSGPSDQDETFMSLKPFRDLASGLASRGIAVLRYNKRTYEHTAKMSGESKINVDDETTDDAVLAVKAMAKQKGIDSRNIFILGHSQGGMMMPRILKQTQDKSVRGSILLAAPSRTLPELMLEQFAYLVSLNQLPKEQLTFFQQQFAILQDPSFSPAQPPKEFLLGTPYFWYDLAHWHPAEVAKSQDTPLLFLQGARDYQVTTEDFEGWKQSLSQRSNTSFKLYPKLNHFFTEGTGEKSTPDEYAVSANIPSYVIDDIVKWVRETKK